MSVVITGAGGNIGRCLMRGLLDAGHDCVGLDTVVPADEPWGDRVRQADLADAPLADLFAGASAVVHLAAIPEETPFDEALHSHVVLTHRVLEAARVAGVGRIIYASSNHAVGFAPRVESLSVDVRPRPDTFYGVGKVAAEALCSLYHDRYGIEVAALRIGSFRDRPIIRRHLSTWLSPGDAVRLVDACLRARELGFTVVYGISGNARAWWSLDGARALGYVPGDDAEVFAAEIEATATTEDDELDARYVGGEFTRLR